MVYFAQRGSHPPPSPPFREGETASMNCRRSAVVSLCAVTLLVTACDRADDGDDAVPPSTTSPSSVARIKTNGRASATATTSAATGPATTQAAEAMISIDGTLVLFPPAKIR